MTNWLSGDIVLTTYGVGVIISCPKESNDMENYHFHVRLWRLPGKSIGTTSSAYLRDDALIEKLPAAPGMTTTYLGKDFEQEVIVLSYYSSSHSYLIAPMEKDSFQLNDKTTMYAELADLKLAPSAKFYPLLVELMKRGDQTAKTTTSILNDENVTSLVQKSAKFIETKSSELSDATSAVSVDENVEKLATKVTDILPNEKDVKQIYLMLKDEELTVLLRKGQQRLQALVSNEVSNATTEALRQSGILIANGDDQPSSFSDAISKSRDAALLALKDLLKDAEVDPSEITNVRESLEANFTKMFDNLAEAAKSDRNLNSIFETISGKTSEWQQATGRLMSTKSGSLFLEGASRLQTRAKEIFSMGNLDWAGEIGSKLTKAFTEGDAAVARLKSIEMGDAVRSRLVDAIEARSGSQGGLDGIIAGALNTITYSGKQSGEKMQKILTNLQASAPGATKDAHETLISVLSNRSEYQDIALLKVESAFCSLDRHLAEEMSPSEIAAIASGEGGTAALFEPIAKRASKEITTYLDQAEGSITDPAILAALKHVRRIISGELTMNGLMDEAVNILNDESILAAGENLVKTSEIALDAIEGMSGNKIAGDVLDIAEKAGITKESVMSQLEALNVNEILDAAGNAVTDENARRELVSSATDTALDFILRILPSMPVPPFDGVKDGLLYNLSNLSLKGFKVKKEDILAEIAGMRATKHNAKSSIDPDLDGSSWSFVSAESEQFRSPISGSTSRIDMTTTSEKRTIKATELLIIDVQQISAVLDHVEWSFEQTYMPYLKGSGKANVRFSGGSIRLQFELRKMRKKDKNGNTIWEPVLCLHDRSCAIDQVDLVLHGESRLTWILNKLAAMFKTALRDYVVKTILGILTAKSGYILEQLNANLSPYWNLILKTTGLSMDELIETDDKVIVAGQPDEEEGYVELVWRENLPLGMNLLLNDDSGRLKVVDFPRGSQARVVCAEKDFEPDIFKGATIIAVNGTKYEFQEDLFDALRNPARPKSILFELANPEDAERVKNFVEGSRGKFMNKSPKSQSVSKTRILETIDVVFREAVEIGIEFAPTKDDFGLQVKDFIEGEGGIVLAAEKAGSVKRSDILTHANGTLVLGDEGLGRKRALAILEKEGQIRPLKLTFAPPYLFNIKFEKPPEGIADLGGPVELKLVERNKRIIVENFENVNGAAETGGVLLGDHLIFINGLPVGAGCQLVGQYQPPELSEVNMILKDPSTYPIALTFARPKKRSGSRWLAASEKFVVEDADTICISADSYEQIGCVFKCVRNLEVTVSDLFAVPGPLQLAMRCRYEGNQIPDLAIESVNGQFVPSYATTSIVKNAMNRSWISNHRIEIVFCDDAVKDWLLKLS